MGSDSAVPGVGDMGVGVDIRDKYEEDGCSSAVGKRDKMKVTHEYVGPESRRSLREFRVSSKLGNGE